MSGSNWKAGLSNSVTRTGPLSDEETASNTAVMESDTNEFTSDELLQQLRRENAAKAAKANPTVRHRDDDNDEPAADGLLDTVLYHLGAYWHAAAVIGVVLLVVVYFLFLRGGGEAPPSAAAQGAEDVRDTGVEFEKPITKDGEYLLKAGDVAWKGQAKETETGSELTLEGATAAQFKSAVNIPDESGSESGTVMTGVFGRAEPDQPVIHATFQRTTFGEQEWTQGTYQAIDNGTVLVEGNYTDARDGETVTRTYSDDQTPQDPFDQNIRYAVSFEAPAGVPIPTLVGWEPPAATAGEKKTA